jgi:hypothetical protein
MDLLDRAYSARSQASVRLHGARTCQIAAAVDIVEQAGHGVYDKQVMQLTKMSINKRPRSR